MILSIIAAIGKNNELGKKNDLLWNLPADMKHFREITSGHAVIMGQKTFESLAVDENGKQIGRLLPNRRNIILTQDDSFTRKGAEVMRSIPELMELLQKTITKDEEVFVIGGGMIYKLMLEYANNIYITHVDESFSDAEIFFPEIDNEKWIEFSRESHAPDEKNIYGYSFVTYKAK
jgi:dihydrofolate reductase